jgi:hypothetical protein
MCVIRFDLLKDYDINTTFKFCITPTTILFFIKPKNHSYPILKKDLSLNHRRYIRPEYLLATILKILLPKIPRDGGIKEKQQEGYYQVTCKQLKSLVISRLSGKHLYR